MITVYMKLDCGCCEDQLSFSSVESAQQAFSNAGFGNGVVITDDLGVVHSNLDTFYGYTLKEGEAKERSLGYLFEEIAKQRGAE